LFQNLTRHPILRAIFHAEVFGGQNGLKLIRQEILGVPSSGLEWVWGNPVSRLAVFAAWRLSSAPARVISALGGMMTN